MLNLPKPAMSFEEIYDAASERFLDQNLRTRLLAARPIFLESSEQYDAKATAYSLHEMSEGNPAAEVIESGELIVLYDQGLLRRRSRARLLYEEIRVSTPYNICPYCNHRNVGQLDHYLAKSKYPIFSLCPSNLIPSCSDCNKLKRDRSYKSFVDSPVHPYFDYFEGIDWLICNLQIMDGEWIGRFEIDSGALIESNVEKLRNHFTDFGLWELYTIQASAELARQSEMVKSFRNTGGVGAVKDFLERQFSSFKAYSNNHWRTALAKGCLANDAYLEG
ncbi:MAG: hypothetical protein GW855_06710 [Erythrobacter sp.]|nr:hypothetical protein [Erythrobacter sp.]NCQ64291.1 hypothetical protein [Alphaproteobacteria bacterium]